MNPNVQKVVVVFKTHFDFGFTALPSEVLEDYANRMIPRALEVWEQTANDAKRKSFVWTLPAWVLCKSLDMLEGTSDGERLERAVRAGGVVWHALPFTTHTESLGAEVLVRGLWYGRRLSERFGRRCISAKMSDVPGHTRFLPSLLAGAGIRFLHLGSNSCSTPPAVPRLFRWQGADGASVITMYSPGGYGSSLLPPEGWPAPVWLALQHTQDNEGPQDARAVGSILDTLARSYRDAEVVTGGLDDFAEELLRAPMRLPVVTGDLSDSWIHGLGSMPREVSMARRVSCRLPAVESAWTLGALPAGGAVREAVDTSYEQLLLFGEHTFGLDTKIALNPRECGGRVYPKGEFQSILSSGGYRRIIESWDRKAEYARNAERAEAAARASSRSAEDGRESGREGRGKAGWSIRLFNANPWPFRGPVELTARLPPGKAELEIFDPQTGSGSPCFVAGGRHYAEIPEIVPLGELRLEVRRSAGDSPPAARERRVVSKGNHAQEEIILENESLAVRIDAASGTIAGLTDRATGKNWVGVEGEDAFGAYRYDVYGKGEINAYLKAYAYDLTDWYLADFGKPGYPDITHRSFRPELSEVSLRCDEHLQSVICRFRSPQDAHMDYGDAAEIESTVTLYPTHPWIDLELRLVAKEPTPFLESGHLVFPVAAREPCYAVAKTGGVIDPLVDIPRNANRGLLCCDGWVDVGDGSDGLLFIPIDTPLLSIGEIGISRFDGDYLPERPLLYFNLFNNQWGTNFPQWTGGNLRFRYRLIPHRGTWRESGAWRWAGDALRPPLPLPDGPGTAGVARLLRAPLGDLEIMSLRPASHVGAAGSAVILRLREAAGRDAERSIELAGDAHGAHLLDLMERSVEELPLEHTQGGSRLRLHFAPFGIHTVRIEGIGVS